jgi:hypothetical protein
MQLVQTGMIRLYDNIGMTLVKRLTRAHMVQAVWTGRQYQNCMQGSKCLELYKIGSRKPPVYFILNAGPWFGQTWRTTGLQSGGSF